MLPGVDALERELLLRDDFPVITGEPVAVFIFKFAATIKLLLRFKQLAAEDEGT